MKMAGHMMSGGLYHKKATSVKEKLTNPSIGAMM
jgi:hypothetical protein